MNLFPWFLFAHVLGAIIAFGPTFSFPLIGAFGAKERQHANFATRVSERISKVQVTPFALLQGITGIGLIATGNVDIFKTNWLLVGIVLYLIAIGYAIFIQTPAVQRVIELSTPPPGAAPGGPPAGGPPAGGPPMGPPPGLPEAVRKVQRGGMLLGILIIFIVLLMVLKPF